MIPIRADKVERIHEVQFTCPHCGFEDYEHITASAGGKDQHCDKCKEDFEVFWDYDEQI